MQLKNVLLSLAGLGAIVNAAPQFLHHQDATSCNPSQLAFRKEWGAMSKPERKAYTDAVNCLMTSPSILDPIYNSPSAYDDFLAVHINMTWAIHLSGNFLPWHRGFTRLYEQALQEKCGYAGTQPYWDWPKYAANLTTSPLFDGSPYSIGSDGAYVANDTTVVVGLTVILPDGNGGGCVYSGPFTNYTAPYRSFSFTEALTGGPPVDGFNYTPSCLKRDLNTYVATTYTNQTDVDILLTAENITQFQSIMSGVPATFALGVHGGGHFTMGGQGADFFASPSDPGFYFHHAQIDRMWTLWQAANPSAREFEISGTHTCFNVPPSANVTLADLVSWNKLGRDKPIAELMSVNADWLCYTYE